MKVIEDLFSGWLIGTIFYWLLLLRYNKESWRERKPAIWQITIMFLTFALVTSVDWWNGERTFESYLTHIEAPIFIGYLLGGVISHVGHRIYFGRKRAIQRK